MVANLVEIKAIVKSEDRIPITSVERDSYIANENARLKRELADQKETFERSVAMMA